MLYELTYSSKSVEGISHNILEAILETASKNNAKNNITGLLIYDGEKFCQILEGEKSVVFDTYERIKQDYRHHEIELFHSGEIVERSFSEWSMSFRWCQEPVHLQSWMEWLTAQRTISGFSAKNSFGCFVLKLINGTSAFYSDKKPMY